VVDIAHFGNLFGTDCLTLIALTSLVVLAGAAENGDLDDDTCQSLAAALVLYAGTNTLAIVAAVAYPASPSPSLAAAAVVVLAAAPAAVASASAIVKYGGGWEVAVERGVDDIKSVAALRDQSEQGGKLELYYKLSFWTTIFVGGAFAFNPLSPLAIINEPYPSAQLLQRAFGLGAVFMLAPAQFVLVNAARQGRMGEDIFKKLNLSIAVAIVGLDASTIYGAQQTLALNSDVEALQAASSGGIYNFVGALSVSFSILAVYLYQGLFAKDE